MCIPGRSQNPQNPSVAQSLSSLTALLTLQVIRLLHICPPGRCQIMPCVELASISRLLLSSAFFHTYMFTVCTRFVLQLSCTRHSDARFCCYFLTFLCLSKGQGVALSGLQNCILCTPGKTERKPGDPHSATYPISGQLSVLPGLSPSE